MNELGVTIKKYRKEKKMTLAELAGNRLTKGMLSLIENGKAQPSMDSLHYIAERLQVDVAQLMNDGQNEQLRELLVEMEQQIDGMRYYYSESEQDKIMQKMVVEIEPYIDQLQGNTFEEVRLLDIYTRVSMHLQKSFNVQQWYDIIAQYEKLHVYSWVLRTYTYLALKMFGQKDYLGALAYLKDAEKKMQDYIFLIDDMMKLDLYYNLTIMHAAVFQKEEAKKYIDLALDISKTKKLYYRLDDFYRFLFIWAVEEEDQEKCAYYLRKLKLHAEYSEEEMAQSFAAYVEIHYATMIEKDYEKAETLYQELIQLKSLHPDLKKSPMLDSERAYAFWCRGMYEECIEVVKDLVLPEYQNHPIDLSILYKGFAIRALCYKELGDIEAAKRDILYAVDGVKEFKQTIYTDFIQQAYDSIMK
ncbi:helix-turn-helix transcriptional regulator [Solibacillus sp. CAU 1738]|uniref:helix-turn-helix domain-containing protein n=1 Tax=Solibacillus sp. CAU 1738 TaxID=3140363 RepID=UPI0032608B4B